MAVDITRAQAYLNECYDLLVAVREQVNIAKSSMCERFDFMKAAGILNQLDKAIGEAEAKFILEINNLEQKKGEEK